MTRSEETFFLRMLQEAEKEELERFLTLEDDAPIEDGRRLYFLARSEEGEKGYLEIVIDNSGEVRRAEMNVGFPTTLGLNRSPLELKMLCEHVLSVFYL